MFTSLAVKAFSDFLKKNVCGPTCLHGHQVCGIVRACVYVSKGIKRRRSINTDE